MRILIVLCIGVLGLTWACGPESGLECSDTKACPQSLVCLKGFCEKKKCSVSEQCDIQEYCDARTNECQRKEGPTWSCRTTRDCRTGEDCVGGFCRLQSNEPTPPPDRAPTEPTDPDTCTPGCATGERCEQGSCVKLPEDPPCKLDADCSNDLKCNLAEDRCQPTCSADADCRDGRTCQSGFCQQPKPECDAAKPCPSPQRCDAGKCVTPPPACGPQKACPGTQICKDGQCIDDVECSAQKACPTPKVCDAGKCVEPTGACGPQQNCPTGQKCWQGKCTRESYCERDTDCGTDQKCFRNTCNGCAADSDCFPAQKCQQSQCVFVQKQWGESCTATVQCVPDSICLDDGKGNKICRQSCDPIKTAPGCAANTGCALLSDQRSGACLPQIGAGALAPGQTCDPNNVQCEVNLACVDDGGTNICMSLCDIQQPNCPNQAKCITVGIDPVGVCEAGGSGSGEDAPCTAQSQCKSGLLCLRTTPTQGVCTPPCDPYNAACKGAKVCDLIVDYTNRSLQSGVCGPFIAGIQEGKLCNYNHHTAGSCPANQPQCLCQSNLFCFLNLQNPGSSLCARPCDPNTKICPAGMQCIPSPILWKGSNLWGCI